MGGNSTEGAQRYLPAGPRLGERSRQARARPLCPEGPVTREAGPTTMAVSTGCHPGGGVLLAPGEQTPSLQPDSLGGTGRSPCSHEAGRRAVRAEVVHAKGWGWGTASVQQRRRTWEAPALWGCGLAPTGALWGSVLYTSGGAHGRESGGSGTSDRLVGVSRLHFPRAWAMRAALGGRRPGPHRAAAWTQGGGAGRALATLTLVDWGGKCSPPTWPNRGHLVHGSELLSHPPHGAHAPRGDPLFPGPVCTGICRPALPGHQAAPHNCGDGPGAPHCVSEQGVRPRATPGRRGIHGRWTPGAGGGAWSGRGAGGRAGAGWGRGSGPGHLES